MEKLVFAPRPLSSSAVCDPESLPVEIVPESDMRRIAREQPEIIEAWRATLHWANGHYPLGEEEWIQLVQEMVIDETPVSYSLLCQAIREKLLPREAFARAVEETHSVVLSVAQAMKGPLPEPFDQVEPLLAQIGASLMAYPTLRTYTILHSDPFLTASSLKAVRSLLTSVSGAERVGQGAVWCVS